MKLKRKTIKFDSPPKSLHWYRDYLIDWVFGGSIYALDGEFRHSQIGYAYRFDSAIQSDNEKYAVIYEKLGTKALLLKNGEVIRELNRSYYQANVYEYPIAFVVLPNNEYGIIHCPNAYNLIEIESVETGEKITSFHNREPNDCFHSRFRVNSSNTLLLNTGWVWHPYGIIQIYSIPDSIKDNSLFDKYNRQFPENAEICTAEFLTNDLIVVSATNEEAFDDEKFEDPKTLNPEEIGLYSIKENRFLKKVKVQENLGNLIPINENVVIDLFGHPKLIDLNSGEIIQRFDDINSGKQVGSIMHHIGKNPPIAIDKKNNRIAIGNDNNIEIITVE